LEVDIPRLGYYDVCLSRNLLQESAASWPQADFVITHAESRVTIPFSKMPGQGTSIRDSARVTGPICCFFVSLPGKYLISNPHTSGFLQDDAILIRKSASSLQRATYILLIVVNAIMLALGFIVLNLA
jgi:hypothetical protein